MLNAPLDTQRRAKRRGSPAMPETANGDTGASERCALFRVPKTKDMATGGNRKDDVSCRGVSLSLGSSYHTIPG